MPLPTLNIFCEGLWDKEFIETFIRPRIKSKYSAINIHLYANEFHKIDDLLAKHNTNRNVGVKPSDEELARLKNQQAISNIFNCFKNRTDDDRFVIVHDKDEKSIDDVKKRIIRSYPSVKGEDISIVTIEIESWYVAGLNYDSNYHMCFLGLDPETLDKEAVEDLARKNFEIENVKRFLIRIIREKKYDINLALKRSPSLREFYSMVAPQRCPI